MKELELLKKKLVREVAARKEAERILEFKANELHQANLELKRLNHSLEETVMKRTAQLAESHEKLHHLLSSVGDIIFDINVAGEFIYMNPVAERILGYKAEELVGSHYSILVDEKYQDEVNTFYQNQLEEKRRTSYLQFLAVRKDGSKVWLGQRVEMQFSDEGDVRISAVARDVQQLVDARKALESSEEKYRGLIEGMELGLLEVNNEGRILKAYDRFCQMVGYSASELVGKDPIELFIKPEHVPILENEDARRERGETGVYEVQLRKRSGEFIWVIISGAPFYNAQGEKMGTMGIHLDITEHKKLERNLQEARDMAEEARQAEKNFLAKMSHEMRTPLNAIIGMSNLLSMDAPAEKHYEYVQDIQYAGNLLLGLITDVLDISKIDAGELSLNPIDVDIRYLVSMLIKTLEYKAKDGGIELGYEIEEAIPDLLELDRNILNQVLMNLIGNAIKFTHQGSIHLHVGTENIQDGKFLLSFTITDTGRGIKESQLNTIFEKYKQEHQLRADALRGTGLGLPICKELVELHGGTISVESEIGKGSTFKFTILASQIASQQELANTVIEEGTLKEVVGQIRLLVAEDNFMNQKYLGSLLNQWGMKYDLANNGQEAVDFAVKESYDLILMDMQMPIMDGYDAVSSIRKASKNKHTPIVALTASAVLDEKRKAFTVGVDYHLTKPFTPKQLIQVIKSQTKVASGEHNDGEKLESENPFAALNLPEKVNAETMFELYDDDLEHAHLVTSIFVKTIGDELLQLKAVQEGKDLSGARKWLHKMKPSISMVGFSELANELIAVEENSQKAIAFEAIEDELSTLYQNLDEHRDLAEKTAEVLNVELQK